MIDIHILTQIFLDLQHNISLLPRGKNKLLLIEKDLYMRRFVSLGIVCLLLFVVTPTIASETSNISGYKGIFIGQSEKDLPNTLKKSWISYEGVHEDDFFLVSVSRAKVDRINVIYIGETPDGTLINKSITLVQALKAHTLFNASTLSLALARDLRGSVWGLVDLSGRITFKTAQPTSPHSLVAEVSYIKEDAPVLKVNPRDILTKEQMSILSSAANSVADASPSVTVIDSAKRYTFSSREGSVRAITEQVDRVIGKGKRTLSLIKKAEIWLDVDERHPEAMETFQQLRKYHVEFIHDYAALMRMFELNQSRLLPNDLDLFSEPFSLSDDIERKMNQIRAMGFSE
jgi:hypothetical protein